MRRIAQILQIELPVAAVAMLESSTRDLERAVRRAVDHVVERGRHVAQEVLEVRTVGCEAAEHETAVTRDPRDAFHSAGAVGWVEMRWVTMQQRRRLDAAVEFISPPMIAATIFVGMSAVGRDNHHAAMRTLIVHERNVSIEIAREQERLFADSGRNKIARTFDLALVPDIDPGVTEHTFELQFENVRIGIEAAVHAAGLDQRTNVVGRWHLGYSGTICLNLTRLPSTEKSWAGRAGTRGFSGNRTDKRPLAPKGGLARRREHGP